MEEKRGLRWLIQQEGALQKFVYASPEVLTVSAVLGYQEGLNLVLDLYKPAGKCRKVVNGLNVHAGSLQYYISFIQACEDATSRVTNPVIKALLLHNAGSASAPHSGNTGRQVELNRRAYGILHGFPELEQDDDWWAVYEKVAVGLYESGAISFDEADYRKIIASMTGRSKDEAGRRRFLADWLDERGRHDEALVVLNPVKTDITSDPTQINLALELLKKLTPGIMALLLFAFQFAKFAVAFQ